jgi:hypothetical protein
LDDAGCQADQLGDIDPADESALAGAHLDQTAPDQRLDGGPDRGPADAEHLPELRLGRQLVAGLDRAGLDQFDDAVSDLIRAVPRIDADWLGDGQIVWSHGVGMPIWSPYSGERSGRMGHPGDAVLGSMPA